MRLDVFNCRFRKALLRSKPMLGTFAFSLALMSSTAGAAEVLIPSYFYPSGAGNGWPQLNAAASQVALTAILNPASGPGPSVDSNYTSVVNSLRAVGGRVIGYVSTAYATRPAAQVKADILKYKSIYSIDGIFLDELTNSNSAAELAYYQDIYSYAKSLDSNYRIVGNPGTNTQQSYVSTPVVDSVITFENDTGYASWNPSAWTTNYATRRFSNIPYNIATAPEMQVAVNAAIAKRVGYVYVTDDNGANPWDRLPTYWNAELDTIRASTSTWASSTSGDWNQSAVWTTTSAPNAVGAEAMLLGAITTPQTVYTNSPITLGTLVLSNANRFVLTGAGQLTMDASVETALIDVRKGNHTINLPLVLHDTTNMFVQAGASLTIADPMTIHAGASLIKQGGGTLNVISIVNQDAPALNVEGGRLVIGESSHIKSLALAGGASIDIGMALVRIDAFDADAIRDSLRDAIDRPDSGLFSTNADRLHAIGYGSTSGQGDGSISLALLGDATRDGVTNFADLLVLAKNYHSVDAHWTDGDFNYDAQINQTDVDLLEQNYADAQHTGTFAGDWNLARSVIPEPALAVMVYGLKLVGRSRRH